MAAMLHRSASSRRRRASRSNATPQPRAPRSAGTSPGRRASIAVSPVDIERAQRNTLGLDPNRSPRHSIIPDIALETGGSLSPDDEYPRNHRYGNVPDLLSPRGNMAPDSALSPRNSLVPDGSRSPRHTLATGDYNRSPRNSLVPPEGQSPKSLAPEGFNRSPRNSLAPKSPRLSPEFNRSPRHSLVPEGNRHGSRLSLAPDFNRSPRNSMVPDTSRSQRLSLVPSESADCYHSSPEEAMGPPRSPRHSITPDPGRSPRGSIAPDRTSPRGSITPERTSPRGSIAGGYWGDRSPKGSVGHEHWYTRSPRGSLVKSTLLAEQPVRSPRGSLTLTFQEPPASDVRRYSADNSNGYRTRSASPYRSSTKCAIDMGYKSTSALSVGESRRPSSSVIGDEQRRLCSQQKYLSADNGMSLGITLTTYGSVAYQLKDANLEASNTCDFVCKAMSIVNRTVIVTILLVCLSVLPMLMLIMGIKFFRDCPREPHIPIYMVTGGAVGCVQMSWLVWKQLHTKHADMGGQNKTSIVSRVASLALALFLSAWFCIGNYWILRIKWPDYEPTLFEPNRWCHSTLYVFALTHLYILYGVLASLVLLVIVLTASQLIGCPCLGTSRYK